MGNKFKPVSFGAAMTSKEIADHNFAIQFIINTYRFAYPTKHKRRNIRRYLKKLNKKLY